MTIHYKISRTVFRGWEEGVKFLVWDCVFFICFCGSFFFLIGKKINASIKEAERKDKGRENSIAIKRIALHTQKGTEKCGSHINRNCIMQIVCYSCFIHELGKHRYKKASRILLIFIRQKVS